MDRNGQLTFSDDPLLTGSNEVYQLLGEGRFDEAIEKLNALMEGNPDYPGFEASYRAAKFWKNRNKEISSLNKGKQTADFLMTEWNEFRNYSRENSVIDTPAFNAVMRYIFFTSSEHYKIAFKEQESTADNFDLLLSLGTCFLILAEHKKAIETLEYARSSYKNHAKLLSMLGESYFYTEEISKSLLCFKEAFFINPSDIDLSILKSRPITDIINAVKRLKPGCMDIREWIPVLGYTEDVFYARRNLYADQVETIKGEIFSLEKSYQTADREKLERTNIIPRLINKYLWMLDYFRFQNYDLENIKEIKRRLIQLDQAVFEEYFKKSESR